MAVVGPVFLDTSVLLAGIIDFGPQSRAAQAIMDAVAEGRISDPLTAWHCVLEFYSVSTRLPEDLRLSVEQAGQLVRSEIVSRIAIKSLPSTARRRLFELAMREGVAGGRIYDAHISEIAHSAQASMLVTDNPRHFTPLLHRAMEVVTSVELAGRL